MEGNAQDKKHNVSSDVYRLQGNGERDGSQEVRDEKGMRVLVACEFSGTVRDAFAARGHDAWSCDLLPTETPGNHIQGDVLEVINEDWDLII